MQDEKNSPSGQKENTPMFGKWTIAAIIGIFAILIVILAIITLGSPPGKTTAADVRTPVPTQTPEKSARPVVDLYVMSFCPYGTQAETVMRPVVDLLGAKTDISVRYITTVKGATVDSIDSLHGPAEAKEDLLQLCIMKSDPEKYWDYLKAFNNQCYPVWQNTSRLDSCRKNVTLVLGIDLPKIEACATGAEGLTLVEMDAAESSAIGASASPTLFINGVKYAGARTPEAFKQAICRSFDAAPSECNTTLSSASAASSGGCG
jgi:glutaredoxin